MVGNSSAASPYRKLDGPMSAKAKPNMATAVSVPANR